MERDQGAGTAEVENPNELKIFRLHRREFLGLGSMISASMYVTRVTRNPETSRRDEQARMTVHRGWAGRTFWSNVFRWNAVLIGLLIACGIIPVATAEKSSLLTDGSLTWRTDGIGPRRFVAVHGHRSAIFGYSQTGLEVWAYPLQIVRSYHASFLERGATREIEGQAILRTIEYRPESVTRIYVGPDFVAREKLFVPLDAAGATITYEMDGARPVDIVVRFVPSLDLMWPASIGGQGTSWSQAASAFLLAEPSNRFSATIGSPDVVAHDDTANPALPVVRSPELAFTIRPPAGQKTSRVVIASGGPSWEDRAVMAQDLLSSSVQLEDAAKAYYADLISKVTQIETPDPEVNRALLWSEIAVSQQWVCTPDLGCAEVAGYGPSRSARRPQYDWFFEDGMVAAQAYLADGQYDRAREELEFVAKYQDPKTGIVWHEISLSAPFMDWAKTGFYYAGIGSSFAYLRTAEAYVTTTGDLKFLEDHWASFLSAYRYCLTVLDPKDGLPHIPKDKVGDNEQDEDRGDSLNLANEWVRASTAFAELATAAKHTSEAGEARNRSEKARRALIEKYWDEGQRRWVSAHTQSGKPSGDGELLPASILPGLPVSAEQRDALLNEVASSDFQTDWGVRSKSQMAPTYDPNLYFSGSVWALGTSETAKAFWDEHRPITAMCAWYALVPWSRLDALGHMHEVLAADLYHEETESVPEQMWSSAAFFYAAGQGLLGIRVNGSGRQLTLEPHIPANWGLVRVRRQRVGDAIISFEFRQSIDRVTLDLENDGSEVEVAFNPEIPLGATALSAQIGGRPLPVQMQQNRQDTHARMRFSLPHGHTTINVHFDGGVDVYPPLASPEIGEPTRALKISDVWFKDRRMEIDLEHATEAFSLLELHTKWKLNDAEGAVVEATEPGVYRLLVKGNASGKSTAGYQRAHVVLQFAH